MKTIFFLFSLWRCNVRALGAVRGSTLLQIVFMLVNNLLFFLFWVILYGNVETVRGASLHDVAFIFATSVGSFGVANILFGSLLQLSEGISRGDLEIYLTQPQDVHLQALSSRSRVSAWGDLLSSILLMWWAHGASLTHFSYLGVSLVSGTLFFVATFSLFHSLIFWLPNSETLSSFLSNLFISLTLYPNTIFPAPLRALLFTLLPAGFISFVPIYALKEHLFSLLIGNILLGILFFLIARWVFKQGIRRYEAGNTWYVSR